MDNRQSSALEHLYKYLLKKPKAKISGVLQALQCSDEILKGLIAQLREMGLKLEKNDKQIQLLQTIDALNIQKLNKQLQKAHIKKPLHYLFSTPSTNLLTKNEQAPCIYITDHQSAGRGRQTKQWSTPLGQSIAISIKHHFTCALKDLAGLNIAIGVALIKTTQDCGNSQLQLKWPNDILGVTGKVAGILIEASGNSKSCKATIGIGINWNVRESILKNIQQACMNIDIANTSRTDFMTLLITEVELTLQEFSNNGLKNILPIWNEHDAFINQQVNITQGQQQFHCQYLGITPQGSLKICHQDEIKTLTSGDVSLRKVDYFEK